MSGITVSGQVLSLSLSPRALRKSPFAAEATLKLTESETGATAWYSN